MRKFTSKCGEKEVEIVLIMSWSEGERVQSGSVKMILSQVIIAMRL